MAISHKTPTGTTNIPEDQLWSESQLLKNRERTNSPPLSRAVFYNPNDKTTQVRRGKNIGQFYFLDLCEATLINVRSMFCQT